MLTFTFSDNIVLHTNTVPRTYVIGDLKGKEIVGKFYEKELQKKKSLELKKWLKEKVINYMLNEAATITLLTVSSIVIKVIETVFFFYIKKFQAFKT